MQKTDHTLSAFPPPVNIETNAVLRALAAANRALAELKGRAAAVPNQGILIDTLVLQEAKASSEIENIVTSQDELFQADLFPEGPQSNAAKEVARYGRAVKLGYDRIQATGGNIANNTLIAMFRLIMARDGGFRVTPGTVIKNTRTGEIVHTPPQDANQILALMTALERFVNDDDVSSLDPLIKMALIHHQFESIHPFPDGNGRIGRILNVLYLTRTGLLDTPILYLSRHINHTKSDYYRLLRLIQDANGSLAAWEEWVVYMLEAVTITAVLTLDLVHGIRNHMSVYEHRIRNELQDIYSLDLLINLFRHPYTRIEFLMKDLSVSRPTATKYLNLLSEKGLLEKQRHGRNNYYINKPLVDLFIDISGD